jgi:hypothetical protein
MKKEINIETVIANANITIVDGDKLKFFPDYWGKARKEELLKFVGENKPQILDLVRARDAEIEIKKQTEKRRMKYAKKKLQELKD